MSICSIGRRLGCTRQSVVNGAAASVLVATVLSGCGGGNGHKGVSAPPGAPVTIRLQSPDFRNGGALPRRLSCDGVGESPALRWSGVPDRTRDFALFVDDPDAPGGTFRHWTLWHMAPTTTSIPAGRTPRGSRQGRNSAGGRGWTSVCPPNGMHHYVFTLVALKAQLNEPNGASPDAVGRAAAPLALATGRLTGTYKR